MATKTRGFGRARKDEVKAITETGTATIRRKVKLNEDGSIPAVTDCKYGKVGDQMWWMESLKQKRDESKVTSEVTSVTIENDSEGVPYWVIAHKKV